MDGRLQKIIFALVLILSSIQGHSQGKIYTKRVKLEDFPTKTVKVLCEGSSFLEISLRTEITARWRISPYEFCTQSEYDKLIKDHNFYFLSITQSDGVAFLTLTKGGSEETKDNKIKPFEVIDVPIACVSQPSGRELMFMGAFVDIIQNYVLDAMSSDHIAYAGLNYYNSAKLANKTIYVDTDEIDDLYLNEQPDAILGISIVPDNTGPEYSCYKMLIAADTHELFYYKKVRYRAVKDAAFTESEKKQFQNRHAILP